MISFCTLHSAFCILIPHSAFCVYVWAAFKKRIFFQKSPNEYFIKIFIHKENRPIISCKDAFSAFFYAEKMLQKQNEKRFSELRIAYKFLFLNKKEGRETLR